LTRHKTIISKVRDHRVPDALVSKRDRIFL